MTRSKTSRRSLASLLLSTTVLLGAAGQATAAPTASDPLFRSKQWALNPQLSTYGVNLGDTWNQTKGAGVRVGVIDSGIDLRHEDLQGAVSESKSFFPGKGKQSDAQDDFSHGTHISGIIAARENDRGVVGIAPQSQLVVAKILDKKGVTTDARFHSAIRYMGDKRVRIVNMSIGNPNPDATKRRLIAKYPDTLFVISAGNSKLNLDGKGRNYPCSDRIKNVICVGYTDDKGLLSPYTNYGAKTVDILAPGSAITSTWWPGGRHYTAPGVSRIVREKYVTEGGSSMAAPMVSGTAALLLSRYPDLTTQQLKTAIVASAAKEKRYRGKSRSDGRLDVAAAFAYVEANYVKPAPTPQPTPAPQPDPTPQPGGEPTPTPTPVPVDPTPRPQPPSGAVVKYNSNLVVDWDNIGSTQYGYAANAHIYDLNSERYRQYAQEYGSIGEVSSIINWDQLPTYTYQWCPYVATQHTEQGAGDCVDTGIRINARVNTDATRCEYAVEENDDTTFAPNLFTIDAPRGIYNFTPTGDGQRRSVRIKAVGVAGGVQTTAYGPSSVPENERATTGVPGCVYGTGPGTDPTIS